MKTLLFRSIKNLWNEIILKLRQKSTPTLELKVNVFLEFNRDNTLDVLILFNNIPK